MNRLTRYILLLSLILGSAIGAGAQDSFKAISPGTVVQGNKFNLTFRFQTQSGMPNSPQGPQLKGCRLLRQQPGVSTMQSVQVINGSVTQETRIDYSFIYLAEESGEVSVPEVAINVNGKTIKSAPIHFNILPSEKGSSGGGGGGHVDVDDITTQNPTKIPSNAFFVLIELSRTKVYEQEPVMCTIYVYTKYDISSFMIKKQPTFDGFLSEDLEVQPSFEKVNYKGDRKHESGNYYRAMLKRAIIYPQKAGTLTINSGLYDVTVVQYDQVSNGWYTTAIPVERKITTESNSATLTAMELPAGAPESFNGAVGSFKVSSSLSPEQLFANDPAKVTFTVEGTGNIKYLKEPTFTLPPGFEALKPKTAIDAKYSNGNMTGTFTITYDFIPKEPGEYTIAPQTFSYFNPKTGKYETLETEAFSGTVAPARAVTSSGSQRKIGELSDILYIREQPGSNIDTDGRLFFKFWYWCLWLGALILLVVMVYLYRRHIKRMSDVSGRRVARANKVAGKRLRRARSFMKAGATDAFYQELAKALWGYTSDKLRIPASQLSRDNVVSELESRGVAPEVTEKLTILLDDCEMARFTPDSDQLRPETMYSRATKVIDKLERQKLHRPMIAAPEINPLDQ